MLVDILDEKVQDDVDQEPDLDNVLTQIEVLDIEALVNVL